MSKEIKLDCGDTSCMFAEKITGMRTNGGCRCFENNGYGRGSISSSRKMLIDIITLNQQLSQQQALLDKYKKALGVAMIALDYYGNRMGSGGTARGAKIGINHILSKEEVKK